LARKKADISNIETELTGENLGDSDEVKAILSELKQINYLKTQGWEIPAPFDFQSIIDNTTKTDPNNLPSLVYQNDDMHCVFRMGGYNQNTILNKDNRLLILECANFGSSEVSDHSGVILPHLSQI